MTSADATGRDPTLAGTSLYAQAVVAETAPAVSSGVRVLFGRW